MKALSLGSILWTVLAHSSPAAGDTACTSIARHFPVSYAPVGQDCVCDARLDNLQAPLRKPFRVVAACGLHRYSGTGTGFRNDPVELRTQKVVLDRYLHDNTSFSGAIYVVGELSLTGELQFDPGNAGTYWFYPVPPILRSISGAYPEFNSVKFTQDTLEGLRIPRQFKNVPCFTAKARIWISGLRIELSDTDGAGAWPTAYRVRSAISFKSCTQE